MAERELVRRHLVKSLDAEESERDRLYALSRDIVKGCRGSISLLVQGQEVDEGWILDSLSELTSSPRWGRTSSYGFVEDAITEAVELLVLNRALKGEELPLHDELGVSAGAYAMGICDAVGELRRVCLNHLMNGNEERALAVFGKMGELFSTVDGLTYPSGMVPLKRKQDTARAVIDRTQGELVSVMGSRFLRISGGEGYEG